MIVGIDLGTTYSVVARYNNKNGRDDVIRNQFGKDLTPSVICFMENGETLIGEEAKEMQKGGVGCIASVFKVHMGHNRVCAELNGKSYTAEDLSRMMLAELVKEAEKTSGEKIEAAVVTVPAYFNDLQRNATKKAAEDAGINVLKIVNEPTAASVFYGYKNANGKNVLVYDLGGGTFDVTVVHVENNSLTVKGTNGDHSLGGSNWDGVLLDMFCDRFRDEFDTDPRNDPAKMVEMLADAEDYKKVLTKTGHAVVTLSYAGNTGKYPITLGDFEDCTSYLIQTTCDVLDQLFETCPVKKEDIDEVLLCGGSTRMPQVYKSLKDYGFKDVISHRDTDLAVAKGAAIMASLYSSDENRIRDLTFTDVQAHSLGMLSIHPQTGKYYNDIMISCNTPLPASVTKPVRIEEGNMTDQLEIYLLQGESTSPVDCTVIKRETITGLENSGKSAVVDVTYSYNDEGIVTVTATRNGRDLPIIEEPVPEDMSWMYGDPEARKLNRNVAKSIAICVDLSRSMSSSMDQVREEIKGFIQRLSGEFTKFALIGFGDKSKVLSDLSTDEDDILGAVDALKVNKLGRGTASNPLEKIREVMTGEKCAKMAIILTDGIWEHRNEAVEDAKECRDDQIEIVAIGFGDADKSFLKQIATVDEGAMYVTLDNLGKAINTIATAIIDSPTGLVESFR